MRLRFRLNEQRVAELLRGINPGTLGDNFVSVTAGLLGCIGDIASLNFMPVFAGDRMSQMQGVAIWSMQGLVVSMRVWECRCERESGMGRSVANIVVYNSVSVL